MQKRHYYICIISILITMMLAGCSSSISRNKSISSSAKNRTLVKSTGKHSKGLFRRRKRKMDAFQYNQKLAAKLQKRGVQVIQVGDDIRLVLPTDHFFVPHSAQLDPNGYSTLNLTATFLKRFEKISIKVAGYTDNLGSSKRNKALSREQAEHIMIYLWSCGIDTRLIFAVGYGESRPITSNQTKEGRAKNRRIEITLRKLNII